MYILVTASDIKHYFCNLTKFRSLLPPFHDLVGCYLPCYLYCPLWHVPLPWRRHLPLCIHPVNVCIHGFAQEMLVNVSTLAHKWIRFDDRLSFARLGMPIRGRPEIRRLDFRLSLDFRLVPALSLIVTSFCIVRLRDSLSPSIYIFFLFYLFLLAIIMLPGAWLVSQVYQISKPFQRNMRKNFEKSQVEGGACPDERKLFESTLRSMHVLAVEVGGLYQMEREAKLTLADNMARGVAFGLLTF